METLTNSRKEKEDYIMSGTRSGKKRHPYAALAVFTVAAAGAINLTRRVKRFVKCKVEALTDMVKRK